MTASHQVKWFPTPEALAQAAAADWVREFLAPPGPDAPRTVALSGGRIARLFFLEAARQCRAEKTDWRSVHFFWADERCVSPGDPESNFALARETFLAPLRVPADGIHRIRGELPPAEGARLAEAELRGVVSRRCAGYPSLDLVLLGMGEDGHVASLFPGHARKLIPLEAVYYPVRATKPPPLRITLTYSMLAAAGRVWVLASGAGKERALRDSLRPGGATPLAAVLADREQARLYTDIPILGSKDSFQLQSG